MYVESENAEICIDMVTKNNENNESSGARQTDADQRRVCVVVPSNYDDDRGCAACVCVA